MKREQVYKVIDSERDFQEAGKAYQDHPHITEDFNLGDAISAIQVNLDLARTLWYNSRLPWPSAMDYIRKIAGLCVQAGEQYGMPERI